MENSADGNDVIVDSGLNVQNEKKISDRAKRRHELWEQFLTKWPADRLPDLTLSEYTTVGGNRKSFCNWLEIHTEELGSVWGGSSYKFGVYMRDPAKTGLDDAQHGRDERYGWYRRYGSSADEVFKYVKQVFRTIIQAVQSGSLEEVDRVVFGHVIKWKIAFLYQPQEHPIVLPIYKQRMLCQLTGMPRDTPTSVMQKMLIDKWPAGMDLFDYYDSLLNGMPADANSREDTPRPIHDEALGSAEDVMSGGTAYTPGDFLKDVFMAEDQYQVLSDLLRKKQNLILMGAPGVGKTFVAKRLAWAMMGGKFADRVAFVQFHQSYSYEDFICGFKPVAQGGFALVDGVFTTFCKKAAADPEHSYFFIIDEINRGNISKIFGELLMTIEADKRGDAEYAVRLAYRPDETFVVPKNLYIIGMMNTADRSLAMMDYALRRRFCFYLIKPRFRDAGFQALLAGKPRMRRLVESVQDLNTRIAADPSLGSGFVIGHSYFCGDFTPEEIVRFDIVPTLSEYWFDNPEKVQAEAARLQSALQ